MAGQVPMPRQVEKWVAELTDRARSTWRNGPGPSVLGKIGFGIAVPGLDAADQRHLAALQRARRAVADVATQAKRLELRIGELGRQADDVADPGQGSGARQGQAARNVADQLAELRRDYVEAKAKQERLAAASRRLQVEIDAFRLAKDAAKAAHAAAEEAAQSVWAEMRN
jgi:DNA repair exonuclease SbcCD ATPase subunit